MKPKMWMFIDIVTENVIRETFPCITEQEADIRAVELGYTDYTLRFWSFNKTFTQSS